MLDNNAQPTPPSAVLGGPPDTSQLPATTTQPPTPLAGPSGPPQPAPSKHEVLGKIVSHIRNAVEGKQTAYVPDRSPDGTLTGQVKEVQVPRKPGGIFRDIISGMLAGQAAAATANVAHPSGAAGLGLGFMGAQQNAQVIDSREKNRAVERATAQKNTQADDQARKDAQTQAQAATAQGTMSSLDFGHHIGLHSDKDVDSYNNSVQVVKKAALDNGGALAQIEHNAEPGNGPALMEAFNKDPQSVMQAPDGFHRIPSITYDTTGLQHKDGKWVNSDGSPLDDDEWNKRATVSLIDMPNTAWGKKVTLTKKSANDVAGRTIAQGNPTDSVSTDFGSLFGLGLKNLSDMNSARAELNRPPKNEAEAKGWQARVEELRKKNVDDLTDDDKKFLQAKGPMVDAYKFKTQAPTGAQIKLQTEQMEQKLSDGTISDADRATLIQRQREKAVKGVPDDIIAAIGPKPVPAQFKMGEKDPQYLAQSKAWGKASLDKKQALQAASGLARYQMMGDIRDYNVTNTSDQPIDLGGGRILQPGEMGRATANQVRNAPPQLVLNTQDGTKVMAKGAAIRDIQYNVDNTKTALNNIDKLDRATRLKIAYALRAPDPESALKNVFTGEAINSLPKEGQDLVIALQSMAENVMLARSVQGIGGAGSDMMRQKLMDLVPTETLPSKEFAIKKMDTFQRTLDQLKTGVPTTGGKTNEPVNPNAKPAPKAPVFDASKLTNPVQNGSTKLGWDGKQWVDWNTGKPYTGK